MVVPVEVASHKEEYAARTLRPKIQRHMERFLVPVRGVRIQRDSLGMKLPGVALDDLEGVFASLQLDGSVKPTTFFKGGTAEAQRRLDRFIRHGLGRYDREAADPGRDGLSHLSPYLHFGQISPVYVALKVRGAQAPSGAREAFLEQLIVRRELSMNFVHFNERYDRYDALPGWARATLRKHANDQRHYTYSRKQLEAGRTHDPYWNAAQREMVITGKMHGYLRMYWGKKLIEWSRSPEEAFRTALYLNNRYELDGRDANGFAGVAWCFGKHDRPWTERAVFGTVRYMNDKGLERKFDMEAYVARVEALEA